MQVLDLWDEVVLQVQDAQAGAQLPQQLDRFNVLLVEGHLLKRRQQALVMLGTLGDCVGWQRGSARAAAAAGGGAAQQRQRLQRALRHHRAAPAASREPEPRTYAEESPHGSCALICAPWSLLHRGPIWSGGLARPGDEQESAGPGMELERVRRYTNKRPGGANVAGLRAVRAHDADAPGSSCPP